MSAHEAAGLLTEIDGYEEELTARTAGLTWILWGIAIPGLFISYNAAGHWIFDHGGPEWIQGILWMPWIAGASLATNWLWKLNAVTLGLDHSSEESWLASAGFTALFFLLAGGVFGALKLAGVGFGPNGWMVLTTGVFTLALGAVYRWQGWPGWREAIAAGVAVLAGGIPIALAPVTFAPTVAFGFASAALVGVAYVGAGIALYLRG